MSAAKEQSSRTRALKLAACVAVGAVIWFCGPPANLQVHVPELVDKTGTTLGPEIAAARAWTVLSIFAAVIVSLMIRPYAMGPMVLLGVVVITATHAADKDAATAGYGKSVTWLVVAAGFRYSSLAALAAMALAPIYANFLADPQRFEQAELLGGLRLHVSDLQLERQLRHDELTGATAAELTLDDVAQALADPVFRQSQLLGFHGRRV